ncbi:hypothetical protein FJZ33_08385, partial [Candidatus Poribacteria bacterium]|nr:hypothetical protein [Candidatus Poribacteria bacterium]
MRILEMLIGNIFVTLLAIRLFRVLRFKIPYLDFSIFSFLWLFITTLYTLILGILGFLDSHKIAIISIMGIIVLGACDFRNLRYFISNPIKWIRESIIAPLKSIFPFLKIHFSPIWALIGFLAFIQIARILFHIWYVPPYVWDTVVYHLVNVAEWVQKGRIHHVITPVGRVYWPANFEVLEAWFTVFLHNDLLIKVGPFLYYLSTGAGAYAIARVLKLNRKLSAFAAVIYLYTPSLAIQATACKNDVGIAALYLLSMAILLDMLKNGYRSYRQILILIMAQLMGIGMKPYMAFIAIAPIIVFILAFIKHRKSLSGIPKLNVKSPLIILCIILVISSGFLGSYWYIRNMIVFNNPFHPTDFRIFGRLIFGTGDAVQFGPGQRGSASLDGLWKNTFSLVTDKIFDQKGVFNSSLGDISGWGWFNFACGLSALIYGLIFVRYLRLIIILFILALLSLFTFISVDPWYMRFTLWFPVVFALGFVFLLTNLSLRWFRWVLMFLAVSCLLLNWIGVLNVGEISVDDFKRMMSLPSLKRSTAELTHHYDGAYKISLEIIPKDEVIGVCFPNNGWAYPLYDSDFSRHLRYIPMENMGFIHSMKEQNIKYLFIERITPEQTELINKSV